MTIPITNDYGGIQWTCSQDSRLLLCVYEREGGTYTNKGLDEGLV